MTKLLWDTTGSKFYETGVDKGVFYDFFGNAVAWNGLSSVTENTDNVTETVSFIDGNRYINQITTNDFSGTVTAFTYPDLLSEYFGEFDYGFTNQELKPFNLSYRTLIGNDVTGNDYGYKIHLIYNAIASLSNQEYASYGAQISPVQFVWNISSIPVTVTNLNPTSHVIIDSTKTNSVVLAEIEKILYGTDTESPYFPSIDELIILFTENSEFQIIDHGDGSFTAIGTDERVSLVESTVFQLTSPTVFLIDDETYQASTL